jgi:Carboxypeptidase regulatory-like domain/TonB dependent receptor-like, beta-barrel/TonB-dependent Receptor Plug Domain
MGTPARFALLLVTLLGVCFPIPGLGQTQTTGQISGTIRDAHGAVIVQAAIQLQNAATGEKRQTVSDTSGNYVVAFLPPGLYELNLSSPGFATGRFNNLQVGASQVTIVNVVLSVASASFEVTVSDTPPLAQSDGPQLATELEAKTISSLPLPTRNFLQLVTLAPGVSVELTNNNAIGRNSPTFFVNGARSEQNNLQINGVNANDIYGHDFAAVAIPAPESIQEVVVQTSMYDASLKSAGGANIQVTTKSGTNQVHGSLYDYLRNDALNANDANLKQAGVGRPELRRHVYGATLGGPIRKERAFYFLSYQGTHEANGATDQSIYKSVLIAQGLTDDRSEATLLKTFQPVLPDGKTPATSIDPISLALLNAKLTNGDYLIPTPQQDNGRVSGTATSTYHEEQFNTNFDVQLRPQDAVAVKYFFADAPQFLALAGGAPAGIAFGATSLPGFGLQLENDNRLLSVSHVHSFSPTAANEARAGYNFLRNRALPQEAFLDSAIGIQRPTAADFPGLPNILLGREEGRASVGSEWITLNDASTYSLSFGDTLSLRRGKHTIRLGGEFCRYWWDVHANVNTYGEIDFPTFNDFLIGNSDFSSIGVGLSHRRFRTSDYNFFVQDDWKLPHKLTLNLGLRYELNLPPYETNGLIGGFDPARYRPRMEVGSDGLPVGPPIGGIVMAGNSQYVLPDIPKVGKRLVNSVSPRNSGPRLGVAWSPLDSGRLVLRGGYGIYFSEPSFFYLAWDYFSPPFYQNFVSSRHTFANPFPSVPAESSFPLVQTGYALASSPFDPNLRTPYFQHINGSIQYEVVPDTVLQVAYVGTRGLRLFRSVAINQASIASLNHPITNQVTGEVITANTNENASLRAPMQGVDTALFSLNRSNGQSTYHSLQVTLNRRLSRGLEFQSSYTFSRSIDNGSFPGLDTSGIVGNQLAAQGNRGLSDFDRNHRVTGYFMWDVPQFGFARNSTAARLLTSHWQLLGIVTVISGLPIDLFDPGGGSLYGLAGARPNWAPGANRRSALSNIPPGYSFNPAAFVSDGVPPGQAIPSAHDATALAPEGGTDLGNVGRNLLRSPSQSNIDVSMAKRFSLTESKDLEFHADFFNLLNYANRDNPVSDIGVADFGRIVSFSSSPRIVQLSLKFNF